MTLDSAIKYKDFSNPSIVRTRVINIQKGADGIETESDMNKNEKQDSLKKKGSIIMLFGFSLIAYVVYKIIENK